ncbi:MAG: flagellar biosynthesis protein FliQ [Paenibacillaceae bacterium]|nr:flagellar biosynthesis protein FliQ [Paenibacillaceae bacterium]
MRTDTIVRYASDAVLTTLLASAPMLLVALIIGLVISVFQAMTQIQEQTLAFVPKILATMLAILFFGPWILTKLINYTQGLLGNLANFVR